jgi:peroxiredoxin Q/BCP
MVAVGEQAPDFELANDVGETVRLSDFPGTKVILYFYPKALTKG